MIEIVFEHNGMLDKFIGDGLMAVFGAPTDDDEQEWHAVQAALEMRTELARLRLELAMPELSIGMGINTGFAVVGNVGSSQRMEYTAIGREVNLAARLESFTRSAGGDIVISRSTWEAVVSRVVADELPPALLKGIEGTVQAYAVRSALPVGDSTASAAGKT